MIAGIGDGGQARLGRGETLTVARCELGECLPDLGDEGLMMRGDELLIGCLIQNHTFWTVARDPMDGTPSVQFVDNANPALLDFLRWNGVHSHSPFNIDTSARLGTGPLHHAPRTLG